MRRVIAGLAGAAAALLAVPLLPTPAAAGSHGRVVVVGMAGLAWADAGPELRALAGRSAVASLSVRAAGPDTPPAAGWLTLSAGNRAGGPHDRRNFDTRPYLLGTALREAGRRTASRGDGASTAIRDTAGRVDVQAGFSTPAADFVARTDADVLVVQVLQQSEIAAVAAVVGPRDTLLVTGVSDSPDGGPPGLRVALARGPAYPAGTLVSASTRRAGFVQLVDLGPTVLRLAGVPVPRHMIGQPWRHAAGSPSVAELADAALAADAHRRYVPPFFTILVGLQLALYGLSWWALRRWRVSGTVSVAAIAFAAVPVSTYLAQSVPWWRHRLWFLLVDVAAWTALVTVVACRGPWRRAVLGPPGAVAGITALVLAVDVLTGARLQLSSLAGYSPVVAGRFAGFGNVAFALFGTGCLLAAAALCAGRSRRARLAIVAAIGVAAVVVDGSPLWGSDFGGVLALVPAFAVLGALAAGVRLGWRRLAAIGLFAVLLVALFAGLDYARPPDARTHLGRFVDQVVNGGAGTIVARKARANLRLLTHSVLTLLVPFATAFVALVLYRPRRGLRRAFEREPVLRAGLLATLALGVVGFVTNDSGVAVPALALTVAVPYAVAASLRAAGTDDDTR